MLAFKDDIDGVGDRFAVLINCLNKGNFGNMEEKLSQFMKDIDAVNLFTISIGISALSYGNNKETTITWRNRALNNLAIAKQEKKKKVQQNKNKNIKIASALFWDKTETMIEFLLPNEDAFTKKTNEIVQKNDNNSKKHWIMGMIDGDDIGKIKSDQNNGGMPVASQAIGVIGTEIVGFCNENDNTFGFQPGGDEFSILMKDEKENDELIGNVMNKLKDNIARSTNERIGRKVTVSIGLARLNLNNDDEMGRLWESRAEKGLQRAKDCGKNQYQ